MGWTGFYAQCSEKGKLKSRVTHIVAKLTSRPPTDYYESFIDLGKLGVYPDSFAQKVAPAAGLRNRLQHEYNQIDDQRVHQAIEQALADFPEYMKFILQFIASS